MLGGLVAWGLVAGCSTNGGTPANTGSGGATAATGGSNGAGSGGTVGSGGSGPTTGSGGAGSGGNTTTTGSGGAVATGSGGAGGAKDAGATDTITDVPIGDGGFPVPPPSPSAGCGMPAGQTLSTYVQKNITSGGVARTYRLYLPGAYDPMRAYPLAILAHGCGGAGGTPFPLETASKNDAIVVALKSVADCFEYSPTGPDVTYFDDVLAEVSAGHCVDKARVFMAGFSSGSWLTHTIGCVRAGIVRAQGNASGNQVGLPMCKGPIAALFAHDINDDQNSFAGAEVARDRILKSNSCGTQTLPYEWDSNPSTPSTCVEYQGCKPGYPVVWCPTMAPPGQPTHNNHVPITTVGLWRFWKQF
jgi:hypothetical protein